MIVQPMNVHDVANELHQDEYNGFTYSGCKALAEYLDNYCDEMGMNIEFDRVAIRSEWTQYTIEELVEQFRDIFNEYDHAGEIWEALHDGNESEALSMMEDILAEHTAVVLVSDNLPGILAEADSLLVREF